MATLKHIGTKYHSGRYPWGSGGQPFQSTGDFLSYINKLKEEGLSEVEIANGVGMNTAELRRQRTIAKDIVRAGNVAMATRLLDKGYSKVAIGEKMGVNESTVRSWLDPAIQDRAKITNNVANVLRTAVDGKRYIDVGEGVERYLGVNRTKLKTSIAMLEEEGYEIKRFRVQQVGTNNKTWMMVLTKPDVTFAELMENQDKISMVGDHYTDDGGRTINKLEAIVPLSPDRVAVRYAEDGGRDKDGVIEIRRGVEELSMGNSRYAQVRIGVGKKHYLKGMAMYSDDLPDGVDALFNTNKSPTGNKLDALKELKLDDAEFPFGADVRQKKYIGSDGKEHTSALNLVNEEGDWKNWSKTISSQMLSKQKPSLAKKQLGLAMEFKQQEFDDIKALTNPAVKKRLMEAFADNADSASAHLKAAGLPRQAWNVILPFPTMRDTEIYAPQFRDGENVVLIRYPHGGTFEIPELTVNNKFPAAKNLIRNAKDAVGISPRVAERISGADFDGDTVLVIPNRSGAIKTSPALKGLKNFDPQRAYPKYEGMVPMSSRKKQTEMGNVSNLITDMTIRGATQTELAAAVRHSMVVIDAEKHKLNYKQSYIDNGIGALKEKYQGRSNAGAATLISRAKSTIRVDDRKEQYKPDPVTGKRIFKKTNETYVNKDGKTVRRQIKSKKMLEVEDAMELSSGTVMERVYGTHANKLKALANEARKIAVNTPNITYSKSAKKVYAAEVASLQAKLNLALRNKPLERKAQLIANAMISARKKDSPNLSGDEIKKIKGRALRNARDRVGSDKPKFILSDREWQAIQAGAITNNKLSAILNNADLDRVKELATPRAAKKTMSGAKLARARNLLNAGYTQAETADALGVSVTLITDEFTDN